MLQNKPNYCKRLGKVDVSKFLELIKDIRYSKNNNYNRESYFHGCDSCFIVEHKKIVDNNLLEMFIESSKDLIDCLQLSYGSGSSDNIQLSLLKSNGIISSHCDNGERFEETHRIHLPIITNNQVEFIIGNKSYNFEAGCVVEINNQKTHSVINRSREDRIHLIIDYKPNYRATLKR